MEQHDYDRLVEPHRAELRAHCYRMLGSAQDAEDALQEALLRAWRGLAKFEGRSSLRSWLYRIATNVCLKMLERRPKLVLPVDYGPPSDPHDPPAAPLVESVWVEPLPGRAPRARRRPRRARGPLRAARERRAGVHRRAPAPAGAPARRAHPARRARLLRPRGRRDARRDAGVDRHRAAARAQERRRAAPGAQPAGDAARARRPPAARDRRPVRRRLGARRRRRGRRAARRGRRADDAADARPGSAAATGSRRSSRPGRCGRLPRAAGDPGERPAGVRPLHVGRGAGGLRRQRHRRPDDGRRGRSARSRPSSGAGLLAHFGLPERI